MNYAPTRSVPHKCLCGYRESIFRVPREEMWYRMKKSEVEEMLKHSQESSWVLPIIRCFSCETSVMTQLFIAHQLRLNQVIVICLSDRIAFLLLIQFSWCHSSPCLFAPFSCVQYFFRVIFHYYTCL